jgi:hypothetical protein
MDIIVANGAKAKGCSLICYTKLCFESNPVLTTISFNTLNKRLVTALL